MKPATQQSRRPSEMISSHQWHRQHAGTSCEYRAPLWPTGRCLFSYLKVMSTALCQQIRLYVYVCVHGFTSGIRVVMGEFILCDHLKPHHDMLYFPHQKMNADANLAPNQPASRYFSLGGRSMGFSLCPTTIQFLAETSHSRRVGENLSTFIQRRLWE